MDPDPEPLFLFFLAVDIDIPTVLSFCALLVLLLCSALVSGTEVAFFSLSQTDINELSSEKKRGKYYYTITRKTKKIISYNTHYQ